MDMRTAEGEKDSVVGMGRRKTDIEVDGSLDSIWSSSLSSVRDMREEDRLRSICAMGISLLSC